MANQWIEISSHTTVDGLFKCSLMKVTTREDAYFLDLRRCFQIEGRNQPTRRGIRVETSLSSLEQVLDKVNEAGKVGGNYSTEVEGLKLRRRGTRFFVARETVEGYILCLTAVEALFLKDSLENFVNVLSAEVPFDEYDDEAIAAAIWW